MRVAETWQVTGVGHPRALALGAAILILAAAPRLRANEDRPRVAYLGSDLGGAPAGDPAACDQAVVKGLQRTAISFVALEAAQIPRTAEGLICAGPPCLAQAASASGAVFFVRAEARPAGDGSRSIEGKVQVFRARPFQAVSSGDFVCDDCTPEALAQRFEHRATDAMVRALAARPPELAVADPGSDWAPSEAPASRSHVGPWIAIGAGAALVAGGAVLIARGDRSTCPGVAASECGRTYSDARTGWLLGGLGAAAIVGGIAWGWIGSGAHAKETSPQVSLIGVGPGGVTVGGRF
ncbi:MAG TPA: hypothetical protein VMU50_02670 [Polyangia bacterium]|nr:hypothetical protein [Polyangia bacterium]